MKVTLIYTTYPEPKPLMFVKDPADVDGVVAQALTRAASYRSGAEERVKREGGALPELALRRWQAAKWVEIDI